jgi:hypothetical protein
MKAGRLLLLLTGLLLASTATAPSVTGASAPATPTLVAIRAAHHPGLDRVVFDFAGGLPASRQVTYVNQLIGDGSGLPVPIIETAHSPNQPTLANRWIRLKLEADRRAAAMPRVTVNGTELYHEIRGAGPPVLLIMGATGDGGHFDRQLVLQAPAPVVAQALGYHDKTTSRLVTEAGGTWSRYAGGDHNR